NICRRQSVFHFLEDGSRTRAVCCSREAFGRRQGFSILPTLNFFRGPLGTSSSLAALQSRLCSSSASAPCMLRANAVWASILAVLLLPGLLLVLLAISRGMHLQEWYVSSMLPGRSEEHP